MHRPVRRAFAVDFFFPLRKASNSVGCLAGFHHLNVSYLSLPSTEIPRVDCKQAPLEKREGKNGHFEEMALPIKKNQAISPSHAESE